MLGGIFAPPSILGEFTWANRPQASAVPGSYIVVSDIASGGSLWKSDGTRWRTINGGVTLARGADVTSVGSSATETLLTINIPAGVMGTVGQLRVRWHWALLSAAAFAYVKWGATTMFQDGTGLNGAILDVTIANTAAAAQITFGENSRNTGASTGSIRAVDTSAAISMTIQADTTLGPASLSFYNVHLTN